MLTDSMVFFLEGFRYPILCFELTCVALQICNMPSLLETCEELFGSRDLYFVLGTDKTASEGQLKKAYHKVGSSPFQ